MFKKREIEKAFKLLNLLDESERQEILCQRAGQLTPEPKTVSYIILDNATTLSKRESKDAELE